GSRVIGAPFVVRAEFVLQTLRSRIELFPQPALLSEMIQSAEFFKVDTQSDGNDQVQDRSRQRPDLAARDIVTQLPQREEHKKNCGCAHENLMGCDQFHTRLIQSNISGASGASVCKLLHPSGPLI